MGFKSSYSFEGKCLLARYLRMEVSDLEIVEIFLKNDVDLKQSIIWIEGNKDDLSSDRSKIQVLFYF